MKVALITARGGSKGLPRKNVLPLNGKPLISWTIDAALESQNIDFVYVSTDDDEIRNVSKASGAKCIDRPKELATDTASSEEVVVHAIKYFKSIDLPVKVIILLQPTSPLRTASNIDDALEIFNRRDAEFVLSVFQPAHTPVKAYIANEQGELKGLYNEDAPYMRRQDLPTAYQPNGAIYIFNSESFMINQRFPRTKVFPYVMSEQDSIDVDTLDDLIEIEKILRKGNDKSSI